MSAINQQDLDKLIYALKNSISAKTNEAINARKLGYKQEWNDLRLSAYYMYMGVKCFTGNRDLKPVNELKLYQCLAKACGVNKVLFDRIIFSPDTYTMGILTTAKNLSITYIGASSMYYEVGKYRSPVFTAGTIAIDTFTFGEANVRIYWDTPSAVTNLSMANNGIIGTVDISALTGITTIDLSNNQINWVKLTSQNIERDGFTLDLSSNYFTEQRFDSFLEEIDANTTNGYTGRSIDLSLNSYLGYYADDLANSLLSKSITVNKTRKPDAPTLLTPAVDTIQVVLTWVDNSSTEDGFVVEKSDDKINFIEIARTQANVNTYTDTNIQRREKYWYRVHAYHKAPLEEQCSPCTNIVEVEIPATSAITGFIVEQRNFGELRVRWDSTPVMSYYELYRKPLLSGVSAPYQIISGSVYEYLDVNLGDNAGYCYKIRGFDNIELTPFTGEVCATTWDFSVDTTITIDI